MTVGEWLATRTPAPPPQLADRVRATLGVALHDDARLTADRCLAAAERLVQELLRAGRTSRESAADLLAADALLTYAFEAAAADPATVAERARDAMVRLARLGALDVPPSAASPPQQLSEPT
jgi:uncharacterized membrane protein